MLYLATPGLHGQSKRRCDAILSQQMVSVRPPDVYVLSFKWGQFHAGRLDQNDSRGGRISTQGRCSTPLSFHAPYTFAATRRGGAPADGAMGLNNSPQLNF